MSSSTFQKALLFACTEVDRLGDPDKLLRPVRTVALVHFAQALIDNGGLQYFFESDFAGQPSYSAFVEAYRTIGAQNEAQAIEQAASLFPFSDPHHFPNRRDEHLEQFLEDGGHRSDSPFQPLTKLLWKASENVWQLLEAYVKRNMESFPH